MNIYIKLGTMPGIVMKLCNKKKPPKVGDLIYVKELNEPYAKKQRALIDGTAETANGTMYLAERM